MRWLRRRRGQSREVDVSAASPLRRALHHVLAGELPAAEVALGEAARVDSSSPDVYLALASLYRARGDLGRAIQVHQNLLLRQDLPAGLSRDALLGLALDFRTGGFLKRATASFEELLELEPDNEHALREYEQILVETGAWEAAIRVRRRIGSRDPATPRILGHLWVGLGRARVEEEQESEARKAFKRALGHDRACAEAYIELGDQRLREDKPKKAIGYFQRVLGLHPAVGLLLYPRLWDAARRSDEIGPFEELLLERLAVEPDDHEATLWLSRVYVRQKRIDEALDRLRRLLDRRPDFLAAQAEIGRLLLDEHRDPDALKAYEELLERISLERPKLQCQSCGTQDTRLWWRCPQCGEWDSFA